MNMRMEPGKWAKDENGDAYEPSRVYSKYRGIGPQLHRGKLNVAQKMIPQRPPRTQQPCLHPPSLKLSEDRSIFSLDTSI